MTKITELNFFKHLSFNTIIKSLRLKDSHKKVNFFYYLTISFFVTGFIFYYYTENEMSEYIKDLKHQEANYVSHHQRLIEYRLNAIATDLLSQSKHSDLKSYINTGNRIYLNRFENELLEFISIHNSFDQARYIDISGQELVRINYNNGSPGIVAPGKLQNKKNRYYFQEAIKLNQGELYVSPLDLNIEFGKIEKPYKPVIRFALPVFDSKGKKRGIFIINYLGSKIINELNTGGHNPDSIPLLINEDGYFLVSEKEDYEWGFMFPGKETITFKYIYPEAWKSVSGAKEGDVLSGEGYFYFSSIDVKGAVQESSVVMKKSHYKIRGPVWKIISYHSRNNLREDIFNIVYRKLSGFIAILILAGIASWFLAVYREKKYLAEQESKKLTIAVMQSPAPVIITDMKGNIEYVNPAFSKITGYSQEEALGQNPRIIKSNMHTEDFYKNMWNELLSGKVWRGEICNQKKDGSLYWESAIISPVKDSQNETVNYIAVKQDISELKRNEEILRNLSLTDGLTGLANRRNFDQTLKSEVLRMRRTSSPLSLMMIDIDMFKDYNDCYGHQAGDECLKSVASVLTKSLKRPGDMSARYGGEEFVLILPETDIHHAMNFAENIRKQIENLKIPHKKSPVSPYVTVSIGVSFADEINQLEAEQLIKLADTALYSAKGKGRNQIAGQ